MKIIRILIVVAAITLLMMVVTAHAHAAKLTVSLAGTYVNTQGETMCRYNNGVELMSADGRCITQVVIVVNKKIAG